MRFICAFLLALFIAIVIVFFMMISYTKNKKFTDAEITTGAFIASSIAGTAAHTLFKEYKSSHSSGGSSGSSGGGGGGGGGGCGGGGHSF